MRIELHCHTYRSFDGFTTDEELVAVCKAREIKAVAITEHDRLCEVNVAQFAEQGIIVVPGIEYTTCSGAHIIALGLTEALPSNLATLDAMRVIRERGALVLVPHPLKKGSGLFALEAEKKEAWPLIDLIECLNGGDPENAGACLAIAKRAKANGVKIVAASDAHKVDQVGFYVTSFKSSANSLADVLELLRHSQGTLEQANGHSKPPRSLSPYQRLAVYQTLVRFAPWGLKRRIKLSAYRRAYLRYHPAPTNYTELDLDHGQAG